MQNLSNKVTGSTLTAAEWDEVPQEIQNVITESSINLSSRDLNQLGKAIANYVANGTFYTDSGTANAYVLTKIGGKQTPTDYVDGLEVEFKIGNTNTGDSTINVSGLGVKNIDKSSVPGELKSGQLLRLRYNATSGKFDIAGNTGKTNVQPASQTTAGIAKIATISETVTGTDDKKFVTPNKIHFGFRKLFAVKGYIAFPTWLGGLIIQWGEGTSTKGTEDQTIDFSIPFNEIYQCYVSTRYSPTTATLPPTFAFFTIRSFNLQHVIVFTRGFIHPDRPFRYPIYLAIGK